MTTNTKKGILPKIGIATILVCLLLAGLVIPEAAKFKASAASNTLMLEEESFIDIRSKVKSSIRNNGTYDLETFVDKTFQEDENNFVPISAFDIGNLTDPRLGYSNITLRAEAEAIRRNRYMDGRIKGPKVSGYAAMSVLTSGQGGLVSHWSNNSLNNPSGPNWAKSDIDLNYNEVAAQVCEDDNCLYCQGNLSEPCKANAVFNFTYKSTSLIEQLRELSGGDVYLYGNCQISPLDAVSG